VKSARHSRTSAERPAIAMTEEQEQERAMQSALRLLGYRARSEEELRRRLQQKGISAVVTDRTLANLTRLGLLDDREFARGWVDMRQTVGAMRLRRELQQKGISRDLAEELVNARTMREELDAAWQVASRAVRTTSLPLEREGLLRVQRLLLRRGFTREIIMRVCARLNDHCTRDGDWLEE